MSLQKLKEDLLRKETTRNSQEGNINVARLPATYYSRTLTDF